MTVGKILQDVKARMPNAFEDDLLVCWLDNARREIYKILAVREGFTFTAMGGQLVYPLPGDIGCDLISAVVVGGILYFVGADGVYRYGGINPKKVSFPIQKYIDNMNLEQAERIAAGSDGERYYLVLPQKDGSTGVFVYDTRLGEWFAEDTAPLRAFAGFEGRLYAAGEDGTVYAFGGGDEQVQWYRISRPYTFENSLHQNWHRIFVRAEVAEGASFTVSLSPWAEGEAFQAVATITKSGQTGIEIPPKMQDAPQMRVKLSGEGNVTVSALEFELRARRRSYI